RLRHAWRRIVAGCAADGAEQGTASGDRAGRDCRSIEHNPTGWWRREESHEVRERRHIIENGWACRSGVGCIFRIAGAAQVQAGRYQAGLASASRSIFAGKWTILGKEQIADPHLDVVGLAGKNVQRLVLRLPTEAADSAVVAVVIEGAGNSQVVVEIDQLIFQQRWGIKVFDQPRA